MASLSSDSRGNRTIQFLDGQAKRRTVRLGKMPIKQAETIRHKLETILSAKLAGVAIDGDTATWLNKIGDDLRTKLAAVGLASQRNHMSLGAFLDSWLKKRESAKPNSLKNYKAAIGKLQDFFGREITPDDITPSMAEDWIIDLSGKHANATVYRIAKFAKQFFKAAVRDKIVTENPFVGLKASCQPDKNRQHHIDRDTITSVIAAAPDAEWRLLIALSRFGGLRCPSEHLAIEWRDIDWERDRFLVRSPKTGDRWIPIFPELRPYLNECFELAEEGAVHVITRYRDVNANLRTTFMKIIKRAGLKPWPKLFHNLRASRETELAAEFPIHVVCGWIGNSVAIASKHYLMTREEDFQRAAKSAAPALQKALQQEAALPRTGTPKEEISLKNTGKCEPVRESAMIRENTYYTRQESNL